MVFGLRSPLAARLPALAPSPPSDTRPVYPVGYTSVSHTPSRPFALPNPTKDGRPTLEVKDVEWSLFYPCEIPDESESECDTGVPWIVGPLSSVVQGYSRFLGVSKHLLNTAFSLLVAYPQTLLPDVHRNARLLPTSNANKRWPLLVFSHGLGGGKHMYSQLTRYYAARGYVVLVLQHKDGTGPSTKVHDYTTGEDSELLYVMNEELTWDPVPADDSPYKDDKIPMRRAQLEIRHAEVYEAFHAFSRMVGGEEQKDFVLEEKFGVEGWVGKVDVEKIHLGGHSFGGATTLHVLSNPPPLGLPRIPLRSVLLLDPWLDPLPPADDAKLADKSLPPVCIVNSEYFTCWTDHFARLTSIMANWGGRPSSCWGTTVLRSRHQDFSDFPLLIDTLPGLPFASAKHTTATPESLLGTISRISESFLSSGTFCAAVDLDEWDGKCDKGRVAILQVPQPKGWFKRGEPKTKKVIEGGEGEVRVHFRGQ